MAYKLFKDTITPAGNSYSGPAEKCITTFSTGPEQIDFVDSWLKNNLVSRAVAEVRNQGGTVLQVTIYRDAAPTWTTDWRVEITAAFPGYAGMYSVGPWVVIIGAIFASLVIYFVVNPMIRSVTNLIWGPGDRDLGDILANPWLWILGGVALVIVLSRQKTKA